MGLPFGGSPPPVIASGHHGPSSPPSPCGRAIRIIFHPQPPSLLIYFLNLAEKEKSLLRNLILLTKGVKALETAVGEIFAPTRFSLVRIPFKDLVADGKSLVRNSGVGVGGE